GGGRRRGSGSWNGGFGGGGVAAFGFLLGAAGRTAGNGARLFFGARLVVFAAVIGGIETAAFENQVRARPERPFDFSLAPSFEVAKLFGTNLEGFVGHPLNEFKVVLAFRADVFISR